MIQRFSLDVNQMTCGRDGEYVRVADHSKQMRCLRDALIIARKYVVTHSPAALAADVKIIDAGLKETDDGND